MKPIEECQANVTRLEEKYQDGAEVSDEDLIQDLALYVEDGDRRGVEKRPVSILGWLGNHGYKTIQFLSKDDREGDTKEKMKKCIIGNFISSHGKPPPNVMARFCAQYSAMES